MLDPLFIGCVLMAISLIVMGGVFVKLGNKKKEDGKVKDLSLIIIGWVLIGLTVVASIVGLIVYIDVHGGLGGTVLFTVISPIFIVFGSVICLAIGISSLVEGYKRNKEGNRNHSVIARGWTMLSLSVIIVVAVIVTLTVLFANHADARGDTPVAFM